MNIYQQQILDNYHNPQNFGKPEQYSHQLKLENLSCGDEITVYLNIQDQIVSSIKYEAEGCAISIASASLLSSELTGKSVAEINEMKIEDVLNILGIQLTTSRIKCAHLPLEAIQQASQLV